MTQEKVDCFIKKAYKIAKEKGFYSGHVTKEECLMGIVAELGEAHEAYRRGKRANIERFFLDCCLISSNANEEANTDVLIRLLFEHDMKDTFEDEIADVLIHIFSLCGYFGETLTVKEVNLCPKPSDRVGSDLLNITKWIVKGNLDFALSRILGFCISHRIPIDKHIEQKMKYNAGRPALHGKNY